MDGGATMTVPKKKAKKKPGPKPQERVRSAVTNIRSSPEWKAAVEAFADWDRAPSLADLLDRAVVSYARERGYTKPFPKR